MLNNEQKTNTAHQPVLHKASVMRRLYLWFARHFICPTIFSNGHEPEPFLYEDDFSIHTHRCSRCHAILGMGKWKGFRNCPPPDSTPEQVKQWEEYFDNNLDKVRRSVTGGA